MKITKHQFEALADLEHRRWSGWMDYMVASMTVGNLLMWWRKANTPYDKLQEYEKESDRKEVLRSLEILGIEVEQDK